MVYQLDAFRRQDYKNRQSVHSSAAVKEPHPVTANVQPGNDLPGDHAEDKTPGADSAPLHAIEAPQEPAPAQRSVC